MCDGVCVCVWERESWIVQLVLYIVYYRLLQDNLFYYIILSCSSKIQKTYVFFSYWRKRNYGIDGLQRMLGKIMPHISYVAMLSWIWLRLNSQSFSIYKRRRIRGQWWISVNVIMPKYHLIDLSQETYLKSPVLLNAQTNLDSRINPLESRLW